MQVAIVSKASASHSVLNQGGAGLLVHLPPPLVNRSGAIVPVPALHHGHKLPKLHNAGHRCFESIDLLIHMLG